MHIPIIAAAAADIAAMIGTAIFFSFLWTINSVTDNGFKQYSKIGGERKELRPLMKADEIIEARNVVRQVYLDEKIEKYIVDIVFATRYPEKYGLKELKEMIGFGGSPRASINLALAARSYAFIKRRGYVVPEDVRAVAHDVLRHRIGLTYEAEADNLTSDEIVSQILNKVEVP